MRSLKNLFRARQPKLPRQPEVPPKPQLKQWKSNPAEQPWFDQPNALELLEQRRKSESLKDREFEDLRHWVNNGYVVKQSVVPNDDIEGMLSDLDQVWTTTKPIEDLVIEDLRLRPEDPPGVRHTALVTLDQPEREQLKRQHHWRIHAFFQHSPSTGRIFRNKELIRLCSLILGRPADPWYTINFNFGSLQSLHQDTAVFFVSPRNYLVGAWLACEDVHPDSGPLVYYPGSHKETLFPRFDNYPQTNLKTCPREMIDQYNAHLDDVSCRYERKTFIAKRGEVFLWHGMMIHGGDAIQNPELTRRSYVCHYIPPGLNKESEMVGPFNW
jgi:phytanoyl-CoA hydroxylase